ncbi:MAG: hypothetical protein KC503_34615 [Myxococcales bacterium]|nr:hypothetical protein [Myxococcales bacterium]
MARPKLLGPYQIVEPLSESDDVQRWVARAAIDGATRRVELAIAKREDASALIAQARALEQLEHPNARGVVDYGLLEGRYYVALDDHEPLLSLASEMVLPDSVVLEVGHALCSVLNHVAGGEIGFELTLAEIGLTQRGEVKLAGARLGAPLPTLQAVARLLSGLCAGGTLRLLLDDVVERGRLALDEDAGSDDEDADEDDDEGDFAALARALGRLSSELDEPISVASWVARQRERAAADPALPQRVTSGEEDEEEAETLVASLSHFLTPLPAAPISIRARHAGGGDDDDDGSGGDGASSTGDSGDDDDDASDSSASDVMGADTKVGLVQDAVENAIDRATVLPKPSPDAALRPRDEEDQPVLPVDWEDLGEPPTVAFDGFQSLVRPGLSSRPTAAGGSSPGPEGEGGGSGVRAAPLDPDAPLPPREEKTGMRRVPTREISTLEDSHSAARPLPRGRPTTSSTQVTAAPHGGGLMRLTTRDVRRQRRPISTSVRKVSGSVVSPLPKRPRAGASGNTKTQTRIDRTARMWLYIALGACAVALLTVIGIYLLM